MSEPPYVLLKYVIVAKPVGGVPLGYIISYAGAKDKMPESCLVCDGSIVSRKEYPELYELIGDEYNRTYFKRNPNRRRFQFWKPKYVEAKENIKGYFRLPSLAGESICKLTIELFKQGILK